jgi:hypothetical protein
MRFCLTLGFWIVLLMVRRVEEMESEDFPPDDGDVDGPKRPVGRPSTGKAMTSAERQRARRERLKASGVGFITVALPVDVLAALDKFVEFKDLSKDEVLERIIRREVMRKR